MGSQQDEGVHLQPVLIPSDASEEKNKMKVYKKTSPDLPTM